MDRRNFPPGVGWLPIGIALLLAAIVSIGAFVPQWGSRVVGTQVQANNDTTNPNAVASGGPSVKSGQPGQPTAGANVPGGQGNGPAVGGSGASVNCAHGQNGGKTAPGVTGTQITIATTDVTTGIGAGFLQEATNGMDAALSQAGSLCGRGINFLTPQNDGWDENTGKGYIENWIGGGNVFALVGEPDSQGLAGAIESGDIDRAGLPVVGTDGMLSDQYQDAWVYPVAASTVTNMHVIVQYAIKQGWAHSAADFAIVYDTSYKFGPEGATAFDNEVRRLTGSDIPGYSTSGSCQGQFCGVPADSQSDYTTQKNILNGACKQSSPSNCKVVVLLLEPTPALQWLTKDENGDTGWYQHLLGGEPLFDTAFAGQCGKSCDNMMVWTGYHPDIQPYDAEQAVYTYAQRLQAVCPHCDAQNVFTEGAYLGTELFIDAIKRVDAANLPLTRTNLKAVLDSQTFADLALSQSLQFGTATPRVANASMTGFSYNAGGHAWQYDQTGFVQDPARGQDFQPKSW